MAAKRILSIGQCAADNFSIGSLVEDHFSDIAVDSVHTAAQAMKTLRATAYDLVLVNRLLDYDGTRGLEIIRQIKADEALSAIPVMLVSNHADAQHEALDAGAVRGFGKANLGPAAVEKIRDALSGE